MGSEGHYKQRTSSFNSSLIHFIKRKGKIQDYGILLNAILRNKLTAILDQDDKT